MPFITLTPTLREQLNEWIEAENFGQVAVDDGIKALLRHFQHCLKLADSGILNLQRLAAQCALINEATQGTKVRVADDTRSQFEEICKAYPNLYQYQLFYMLLKSWHLQFDFETELFIPHLCHLRTIRLRISDSIVSLLSHSLSDLWLYVGPANATIHRLNATPFEVKDWSIPITHLFLIQNGDWITLSLTSSGNSSLYDPIPIPPMAHSGNPYDTAISTNNSCILPISANFIPPPETILPSLYSVPTTPIPLHVSMARRTKYRKSRYKVPEVKCTCGTTLTRLLHIANHFSSTANHCQVTCIVMGCSFKLNKVNIRDHFITTHMEIARRNRKALAF